MADEINLFRRRILEESPRLSEKDTFQFACHPNVPCFNDCCADMNIFLTPYDIIRLKDRLGITSGEFLERYSVSPPDPTRGYPVVLLRMRDDEKQRCPFVTETGCRVYEDRPWPCRMYPVGSASPGKGSDEEEFYVVLKESVCRGFDELQSQTIAEWQQNQGVLEYAALGQLYIDIVLDEFFESGGHLLPEQTEMFHMVCYDIDKFRQFVFEGSFFDEFAVPENVRKKITADDVELFKFGCQWLRCVLFGEKTIATKDNTPQD